MLSVPAEDDPDSTLIYSAADPSVIRNTCLYGSVNRSPSTYGMWVFMRVLPSHRKHANAASSAMWPLNAFTTQMSGEFSVKLIYNGDENMFDLATTNAVNL